MLIDVWPVPIITRVEAFFAFLGGKGAKKNYFTYIFVIREQQSMTYQKFLHSDRVPLSNYVVFSKIDFLSAWPKADH